MHNKHLIPHQQHHTILQPASLPSAEISDAQSTLFATEFTELTGTLNFKIHLKCKVEMSQVVCLALSLLCKCGGEGSDFSLFYTSHALK